MQKRTILGIDPGTNVLGYAIIQACGEEISLVEMGVVNMRKYRSHQEKLLQIFQSVAAIILKFRPDEMAVEAPFYGKNPQSMLKLGRAQGVAIAAGLTREIKVTEYSPKKIKLAITGSGNSSKEQVAAMVSHLVEGNTNHKFLDASDALATAVCHHFQDAPGKLAKRYNDWSGFLKDNPGRISRLT